MSPRLHALADQALSLPSALHESAATRGRLISPSSYNVTVDYGSVQDEKPVVELIR